MKISSFKIAGTERQAFTLIELLVVVAVILILMSIAFRLKNAADSKMAEVARQKFLEDMNNAVCSYYAVNGFYPPGDLTNSVGNMYARLYPQYFTNNINGVLFDSSITNVYPTANNNATYMGLLYFLCFDPQAGRWANYLKKGDYFVISTYITNATYGSGVTPRNSVTNKLAIMKQNFTYTCSSNDNYQSYKLQ